MKLPSVPAPFVPLALVSVVFAAVAGGVLAFHWGEFPSRVVLHFAPTFGADLFGERADVLILWILGVVAMAVNAFLAKVFYDRVRELTFLFVGLNVLVSLLLLVAIGTIVAVN